MRPRGATGKDAVLAACLPLAVAFLTYLVAGSGLVYAEDGMPEIAVGLIVGLAAGLAADSPVLAALVAPAAILAGLAVHSSTAPPATLARLVLLLAVAAVGASGAAFARRVPRGRTLALLFAVVLVVGNMLWSAYILWTVPLTFRGGVSVARELETRPPAGVAGPDSDLYREIVWNMKEGLPYYAATAKAWRQVFPGHDPHSVFDIRQPAPFLFWSVLPGWPTSVFWAFMALAAVAAAAAPMLSSRAAPFGAAVPASTAVAAYLIGFALTRQSLFMSDSWVGALAVVCFAAVVAAQRDRHHRAWVVLAAGIAFLTFVTRELSAFLLLAGLVSAPFAKRGDRVFDFLVWTAASLSAAAAWALHASRAAALVSGIPQLAGSWIGSGGIDFFVAGTSRYMSLLSTLGWVPWVLIGLGVGGALVQPDRQYRIFASVGVLVPLVGFLFVGNRSYLVPTHMRDNYWAIMVLPAVFALAPSALSLLVPRRLAERLTSPVTAEVPEPALPGELTAIP